MKKDEIFLFVLQKSFLKAVALESHSRTGDWWYFADE